MALAWYLAPYKRRNPGALPPERYCAMDDFTAQIRADGGDWAETEILGQAAIVKVRASAGTLIAIAQAPGFTRIPNHFDLDDTLGDLTGAQRQAIRDKALQLGYTAQEISDALPQNWQAVTLRQVLRFLAKRRLRPRYDEGTDTVVCDGAEQPVRPVESVDAQVR